MLARMQVIIVAVLLSITACGNDDAGPVTCPDAGTKVFGETCAAACECTAPLDCFTFGDGTTACTPPCSSDDECPSGSQGQKCNGQGRCRP